VQTQEAIDSRNVPFADVLHVLGQQFALVLITRVVGHLVYLWTSQLSGRLRQVFDLHLLELRFQLDLPSLEDENLKREMRILTAGGRNSADRGWQALTSLVNALSSAVEAIASSTVLWGA
jgi:hypothetical protein